MALSCLTAGRMTMRATLLHRSDDAGAYVPTPSGDDINLDDYGAWEDSQDPLTGQIIKVWEPYSGTPTYNDYFQPPGSGGSTLSNKVVINRDVPCIARGVVDGGIRVAGTTERFGENYENVDYVKMWLPANVIVTKQDRITNIRDRTGRIRWLDEEYYDPDDPSTLRATVFNVNGVTPLFDAFNNISEWYVMLERATDT